MFLLLYLYTNFLSFRRTILITVSIAFENKWSDSFFICCDRLCMRVAEDVIVFYMARIRKKDRYIYNCVIIDNCINILRELLFNCKLNTKLTFFGFSTTFLARFSRKIFSAFASNIDSFRFFTKFLVLFGETIVIPK